MPTHQKRDLSNIPSPHNLVSLDYCMGWELHVITILLSLLGNQFLEVGILDLANGRYLAHVLIVAPRATTFQFVPSDTATVAAPEFPSVT